MNYLFDYKNTYYFVEETNKTWATKRAVFVEQGDAELEEFIESGNQPIALQTEQQLIESLEIYGLPRGTFAPVLTFEEVRFAKLAEINAGYSSVMQYIQAGYPAEEVLSWERQAAQARELVKDATAPAAFVRGLAAKKGVTIEEMCRRILENAASWEPIAAMLTAERQLMEEKVWATSTIDALNAVVVKYSV